MDNDDRLLRCRRGPRLTKGIPREPLGVPPAVLLCNPKYDHNVGAVLRACACYGISQLWYTGNRVCITDPAEGEGRYRLPREERMRGYSDVSLFQYNFPFNMFPDAIPVAVELLPNAEALPDFTHLPNMVYVFGPEDKGVPQHVRRLCRRFVAIPSRHCLNLAAAVYTVLYDRQCKLSPGLTLADTLVESRGLDAA